MKKIRFLTSLVFLVAAYSASSQSQPISKVEAEYRVAESSTTNLHEFIGTHPNDAGWCGEAQIRIGRLLRQQGDYAAALTAYRKAITNFGTNAAPDRNLLITVSDVANVEMALCLKNMGRNQEAISTLSNICNRSMRESLMKTFQQYEKK